MQKTTNILRMMWLSVSFPLNNGSLWHSQVKTMAPGTIPWATVKKKLYAFRKFELGCQTKNSGMKFRRRLPSTTNN
jgi:hypothetical protein